MIPAIAYLRCSDPKQDRSVSDQRAEIEERAKHDGARIIPGGWFLDDGISGLTVTHRPGILALRRWLEEHPGEARCLYAWAQSRLGRDPLDTMTTLAMCDEARVETRFLTDPEPADHDTRDLLRAIRGQMDAQHSRRLRKDVPRGMRRAACEGRWTFGHCPFGYERHHDVPGKAGRLVAVLAEAEVVRMVFDLYEAGDGFKVVADVLSRRGVPAPERADLPRKRAPGAWTPKHVRSIVTSAVYAGRVMYKGEAVAPTAHEPIIDPVRFDRMQALRRSRDRGGVKLSPMRQGERGLFTPWLRCAGCGGKMRVQRSTAKNGIFYYHCSTHIDMRSRCTGINARIDYLDPLILDYIDRNVLSDDVLRDAAARWRVSLDTDGRRAIAERRAQIEARLAAACEAIKRTVGMVAAKMVELADIADAVAQHTAARDAARDDLALLPLPVALPEVGELEIVAFRASVRAAFDARPIEARRAALQRILTEITLAPNTLSVRFLPRFDRGTTGYIHHEPEGPPWGACARNGGWWKCERVGRPRGHSRENGT